LHACFRRPLTQVTWQVQKDEVKPPLRSTLKVNVLEMRPQKARHEDKSWKTH